MRVVINLKLLGDFVNCDEQNFSNWNAADSNHRHAYTWQIQNLLNLQNVCTVHLGMFSTSGDNMSILGVFNIPGDIMSTPGFCHG